jgi:hypothetical protein
MQRNTIFFIAINAVHVLGGFPAHHQGLKNCTYSIGYMQSLLAATASGSSEQATHKILWRVCTYYLNLLTSFSFVVKILKLQCTKFQANLLPMSLNLIGRTLLNKTFVRFCIYCITPNFRSIF